MMIKRYLRKVLNTAFGRYYLLKSKIWFVILGAEGVAHAMSSVPQPFISSLLKYFGANIGNNTTISEGIILHNLGGNNKKKLLNNLTIGDNCYIGRGVLFDLKDRITVGDHSAFGARCQIWTHVGDYSRDFSDYHEKVSSVKVGRGVLCWSGIIVSPGVTVGDYVRVASGSVVIRDVEPDTFVGGVPAKYIRHRT